MFEVLTCKKFEPATTVCTCPKFSGYRLLMWSIRVSRFWFLAHLAQRPSEPFSTHLAYVVRRRRPLSSLTFPILNLSREPRNGMNQICHECSFWGVDKVLFLGSQSIIHDGRQLGHLVRHRTLWELHTNVFF